MAGALALRDKQWLAGALLGLLVAKPSWFVATAWIPVAMLWPRMLGGLALGAGVAVAGSAVLLGGGGELVDVA